MQKNKLIELKQSILDELENLKTVQGEILNYAIVNKDKPTIVDLRYFASVLHDFYMGLERIFEKIARYIDNKIPKGEFWHSELLLQMSKDLEQRPGIISKSLSNKLEDFLKFRHVARNVYGFHLEWHRLKPLLESFGDVFQDFEASMDEFLNFLDTLIQASHE